ncbi:MAG: AGE family epimerase/isomerase, partial [Armatimonadetes bacterium]|nr:AGE family epimerase/isomerase [Armatimonadota bacterium]
MPLIPPYTQAIIWSIPQAVTKTETFADIVPTIERSLDRDILGAWYPRAVDDAGGFHQTFAADWKKLPDDKRGTVYQSRLTWVAAQAALHAKSGSDEQKRYRNIALHGLDYLQKTMWDAENGGGFFFEVSPTGKPTADRNGEKHAYGIAFGIYASCAVYEATKDERALKLAQSGFAYLEKFSHDAKNGGYVEALSRDNKPVLRGTVAGQNDSIGTPYGYKSMNTHIHLLEAVTALYAIAPTPEVKTRLAELLTIVRDKVAVEPGCLNLYLTPDFRPVPGHDSFG